jgi:hypothetical protein
MMRWFRRPFVGHGIILAVLVASVGVTRAALVGPRERERRTLESEAVLLASRLEDFQRGAGAMDAWARANPGRDPGAPWGRRVPPARTMVASFLSALAPIAGRHQVSTEQIEPEGAAVDEVVADAAGAPVAYQRVELRFRIAAAYRNLGEYLREIEGLDQMVVVRSVDVRFDPARYPRLIAVATMWLYGTP